LVPRDLIALFNDHELELLISGLPDIDVADLRRNTEYQGYAPGHPVITWFWQTVEEMDKQDLALLLQFVTGGWWARKRAGSLSCIDTKRRSGCWVGSGVGQEEDKGCLCKECTNPPTQQLRAV
jgi:hypothetical protein